MSWLEGGMRSYVLHYRAPDSPAPAAGTAFAPVR